jgi:repressor LexA
MLRRLANKSRAIELTEFVSRQSQTQLLIGGKLIGDVCSLTAQGPDRFDIQHLIGPQRFAIEVIGDKLREVQINSGDLMIVQRQKSAAAGQLALVQLPSDSLRLFYWMPESARVRLQPLDRTAQAQFVGHDAEIIGIAVGLIRRFA